MGVVTIAGEVNLVARYLPTKFDDDRAGRFIDTYAEWIERLVEEPLSVMAAERFRAGATNWPRPRARRTGRKHAATSASSATPAPPRRGWWR